MKIGVMTFWNGDENYGQIFQCWALQQFLKKENHDPFVIRYIPTKYNSPLKEFVKKTLFIDEIKKYLFYYRDMEIQKKNSINNKLRDFSGFRNEYINFSTHFYYSIKQLQKNPPIADAYIVGSDQVWAQLLSNRNNRSYFLDFGHEQIKRIAYAPSFVMKKYPFSLQQELKDLLSKFDAISVREYSGVDICGNLGFAAKKVLDPTLLLNKDDYKEIMETVSCNEDFVFIYSLNIKSADDVRWSELEKEVRIRNLKVKVTPAQGYFAGKELFGKGKNVDYVYATPQKWLSLIAFSNQVVTTSFHGIVFSIILEKPFVYIPLKGHFADGNARILDLLKDLKLEHRVLNDNQSYDQIMDSNIDWREVKSCLYSYQKESINFIRKAL